MWKPILRILTIGVLAAGVVAAAEKQPIVEALVEAESRTPVVFVPGLTGSKLRDRETGKTIWGGTGNLLSPRDGGRELALPIVDTPAPGEEVEAYEIVEKMSIGIAGVRIYEPLIDALVANGFVRGNLLDPHADETLLVFPYDWRYGTAEAAAVLADRLENLRRVRGAEVLHVALVCHSNAARIARWYVKFGGGTLSEAEAGGARKPDNVVVEKIVFVGTGQGGALPTFVTLDRGRRYVPLGRMIQPETMFSIAGLYEALPAYRDDLFFDADGRILDVDLFDAANWPRYGWSIFGADARRRVDKSGDADPLFGNDDQRMQWLERRLERARRIHAALMQDVPDYPPVKLYQVQGTSNPTPSRAMLFRRRDGRWETLTIRDRQLRADDALAEIGTAPGDRHATRGSQEHLSPQERKAVVEADFAIDAVHRTMFNDLTARRRILEYLADPPRSVPPESPGPCQGSPK